MVNVNKLKGKIVELGMNVAELAEKIGIDKATLYRKLGSEGKNITIYEAGIMAKELNLTFDEINAIFFASEVA